MDFARRQLEKYGWTDGKGLGKKENGISEALKPKLKRSVTGIGHDAAADFTEHWWSALYDKAAGNVQIEEKNGKTKKIKRKDDSEFQITNSTWRLKKKSQGSSDNDEYKEYFVKKATLSNDGVKMENVSDSEMEEDERKQAYKMTDEELFAACGGRTAHKAARFGLKATGKLARIQEQEQKLLIQDKYNGYSHAKNKNKKVDNDVQVIEDVNFNSDTETISKKKKNKKQKDCINSDFINVSLQNVENENSLNEDVAQVAELVKTKKKNTLKGNAPEDIDEVSQRKKVDSDLPAENSDNFKTKKTKKRSNFEMIDPVTESLHSENDDTLGSSTKKKKKQKRKD